MKNPFLVILAVIGGIALLVALWFVGWQVAKANTDQQYQVNTHSQQYQASLVQQEQDRVQGYDTATDPAQKQQISATFCSVYQELTHPETYPDLVQANARICN